MTFSAGASGGPNVPIAMGGFMVPGGSGAQTNDLGEFRLFSLPPGEYYVQANQSFGAAAPRGRMLLPTYFPDATDPSTAQPVAIAAGQTSGEVVIRMVGAPSFQVSGVVLDESRRPVANAIVRLNPEGQGGRFPFMMGHMNQARTEASGAFTIDGVTSGSYTLLAIAPVTSGRGNGRAPGPMGSGGSGFSWSGAQGGAVGGGVMTETSADGVTTTYRDDAGTSVPVSVQQNNIVGLEVIVRRPAR
jgi:hypothetical protein